MLAPGFMNSVYYRLFKSFLGLAHETKSKNVAHELFISNETCSIVKKSVSRHFERKFKIVNQH